MEMRLEPLIYIHSKLALGKVLDMTVRCLYDKILAPLPGKGFHFGRGLDYKQ